MVRLPCDLQRCSPAARLDLGWSNRSDFLRSLFVAGPRVTRSAPYAIVGMVYIVFPAQVLLWYGHGNAVHNLITIAPNASLISCPANARQLAE